MALETLKDVKEIGGYKIGRIEEFRNALAFTSGFDAKQWLLDHPIMIDDKINGIQFKIQNGPIKEAGVNGCQVETIIHTAFIMLQELNKKVPCKENEEATQCLFEAIMWLKRRTKDREARGVEGTSNE